MLVWRMANVFTAASFVISRSNLCILCFSYLFTSLRSHARFARQGDQKNLHSFSRMQGACDRNPHNVVGLTVTLHLFMCCLSNTHGHFTEPNKETEIQSSNTYTTHGKHYQNKSEQRKNRGNNISK